MKHKKKFYLFYYDTMWNPKGKLVRRSYYSGTYSMPTKSKLWKQLKHKLTTGEAVRIGCASGHLPKT
jgi:hypothetical protein